MQRVERAAIDGSISTPHCVRQLGMLLISGREYLYRFLRVQHPHDSHARWDNFTECFLEFCEIDGDGARLVFDTVSRHLESSLVVCFNLPAVSSIHDHCRNKRTGSLMVSSSKNVSITWMQPLRMRNFLKREARSDQIFGERTSSHVLPPRLEPYHHLKRRGTGCSQYCKRYLY